MFLTKKSLLFKIASLLAVIGTALFLAACPDVDPDDPNNPNNLGNPNNQGQNKIKISGNVSFANQSSSGQILIYLEKTDGLYAETVQSDSRAALNQGNRKKTTAKANGGYSFDNIDEGIYTIYAATEDETEQAVLINVPVMEDTSKENTDITVEPMTLKPVGSIKGRVVLEGSDNNLGFTVFAAGTSFTAITDTSGYFEISNVPAETIFQIAVMKGVFAAIWTDAITESDETYDLGEFQVTASQILGDAIVWKGALSAPPSNPQKNWSYFNTTDRKTYIYNGTQWTVTGQVLTTSNVEYRSIGHTSGSVPIDTNPDGGYVFGATVHVLGQGSLIRNGYCFCGWSREGSSVIYQSGDSFTMGANPVVLNAIWLQLFTVSYDGNGNDSGITPQSSTGVAGENISVSGANTLVKDGYRFIGWSTDQIAANSQYSFGSSYIINSADVTLYAVWSKLYTVTYDGNGNTGGAVPQAIQGIKGEQFTIPNSENMIKTDKGFAGWNTKSDATGTAYFYEIIIKNDDIVLYAIWSEFLFDNGVISGYSGNSKDIIIPTSINTKKVTHIGYTAFYGKQLTSVVIPDSVTSIGDSAFYDNRLSTVVIPDKVTIIGSHAFAANRLTSVVIPDSVTSIGGSAFYDNRVSTVVIPDKVTIIGSYAFAANRLTSVVISNSVTVIEYCAFAFNQLTSVVIPDSVISIGDCAFEGNQLTSVVIPNSVTTIGDSAFGNSQLTSVVIPDSITSIGEYAFFDNPLTSITIPANINIDSSSMGDYGESFKVYYNSNGKKAGTYTYNTGTSQWTLQE